MAKLQRILFTTVVLGLLFSSVVLAGTEITFWHAMAGQLGDAIEYLVAEFNAENPDIVVRPVFQGHYDDLNLKLAASLQARTTPTIAQVYENWTDSFIRHDVIVPLEDYLELSDAEYNDYIEVFRNMNTWDEKLYTVPFNKSNYVLYYNTELIPEPPRTLEEFLQISRNVTADTGGETTGFGFRPTLEVFHAFLHLYGGDFLDEDLQITFDQSEGVDALRLLTEMIEDGSALLIDGFEDGALADRLIAMYLGASSGLSFVEKSVGDKFQFNTALFPEGIRAGVPFMGTNIALFKAASEEERIAAAKFIKFLTSTENTVYFAIKTGYLPVTYSGLNSAEYQEFLVEKPHISIIASPEAFARGYWQPRIAAWEQSRRAIVLALEKVLLGNVSIEIALADARAEIQEAIDELF